MPRRKGPRKSHGRPTAAVDLVARNRLVEAHMDLVHEIAKGIAATSAGSKIDRADLFGEGAVGLLEAAQTFDPERGVPFEAFARCRIKGAIFDGIRKHHWLPKRTYKRLRGAPEGSEAGPYTQRIGPAAGASLDVAEVDETERNAWWNGRRFVQPAAVQDDQLEVLTMAEVQGLPERDRRLIQLHYREDRSLSYAAQKLRFGRSWACRRHTLVLASIRKVLEKRAPDAVRVRRKAATRAAESAHASRRRRAKRS
jgi:RNA polymerase sigma factor for flagellar operon FliA